MSLKAKTKEVYAINIQTFIEEVKKDFANKQPNKEQRNLIISKEIQTK